eukprot:3875002-Amphidinium_carterae.2
MPSVPIAAEKGRRGACPFDSCGTAKSACRWEFGVMIVVGVVEHDIRFHEHEKFHKPMAAKLQRPQQV